MLYECPKCSSINSGVEWQKATAKFVGVQYRYIVPISTNQRTTQDGLYMCPECKYQFIASMIKDVTDYKTIKKSADRRFKKEVSKTLSKLSEEIDIITVSSYTQYKKQNTEFIFIKHSVENLKFQFSKRGNIENLHGVIGVLTHHKHGVIAHCNCVYNYKDNSATLRWKTKFSFLHPFGLSQYIKDYIISGKVSLLPDNNSLTMENVAY